VILRRHLRVALGLLLLTGVWAIPVVGGAVACASNHGRVFLTGFPGGTEVASLFYAAGEGGSATARIRSTPGCFHIGEVAVVRANYTVDPGSAFPADYSFPPGPTGQLCQDVDGDPMACSDITNDQSVPLQMTAGDGDEGAAVERFTFRLTGRIVDSGNPVGTELADPSSAPVYVIDADGANRFSLEPGASYSRSESYASVLIPVFRAGPAGSGQIGFSVEPSGSPPATQGEDYIVDTMSPLTFASGRLGFIRIGIINDKLGEGPETLTITLTGAAAVAPASLTFTILDNEENVFPVSRFHHPREGWRYKKSDYRIREFHVFASDEGGSGVVAAEIAVRKNMKNGDCLWLTPGGWQKKDCSNRQWLGTTYDDVGQLFRLPMKQLKSSVKTKIVDYTAYSRAIDGAGNVENRFDKRRNANTFEIKRTKRKR
jgi:hypothetical protein